MREICDSVESILPDSRPLEHHAPILNEYIAKDLGIALCLGSLESQITLLQTVLASWVGRRNVVLTNSGTSALHLALLGAGVLPGEAVLVPTLTFAACANAVRYCNAVPIFIDGAPTINSYKLRRFLENETVPTQSRRGRASKKTGAVISAVMAVDLLGFPADYEKLQKLADEFGLALIEDASQALGSAVDGQFAGNFGLASVFSFNTNKIITGFGGGALLTDDDWLAAKASNLSKQARTSHDWLVEVDDIGFNYRMSPLSAFTILKNIEGLGEILTKKARLLDHYNLSLRGNAKMLSATQSWHGKPNYWLSTMLVKPDERDEVLTGLHNRQIKARALFTPLHRMPAYSKYQRQDNMMYADDIFARAICLPSGGGVL